MIVKKPWGTYEVLLDEPNYKVKRIVVHPYERFSLQYHKHREEHWVVVEGDGIVQVNQKEYPAIIRSHWVILPKELHRATAGPNGLIFIETQIGDCREDTCLYIVVSSHGTSGYDSQDGRSLKDCPSQYIYKGIFRGLHS